MANGDPQHPFRQHPHAAAQFAADIAAKLQQAVAFHQQGKLEQAESLYREIIRRAPRHAGAIQLLGVVAYQQGRVDQAERLFSQALAIKPDYADALSNHGRMLVELNRLDEALANCDRALAIKPDYVEALNNRGNALLTLGRLDEALESYIRASAIKPDYAEAHWNEGLARLAMGEYEIGWRKFEWRWVMPGSGVVSRGFRQPLWRGDDLAGKTILLHAEQGLGDSLQFVRYVPLVAARGGRILLEVQAPLVGLMATLAEAGTILAQGASLPPFDVQCPLMSLPLAFGTRLDTIPAAIPYLAADPAKVASWRRRLAVLGGLRVGLVWAGSPRPFLQAANAIDRRRSITLAHLAPLADVPGVTFISLQKGDAAAQIRKPPSGMVIHDWTSELKDFADTAALIAALDLVISVDTSVVHAAGALGAPVWMLNRYDSCWRWLLGRNDSPWYPSLQQFRQPAPGDWASVLATVRQALTQRAAAIAGN